MMEFESDFSALFAPEPAPTGLVAAVPCWQVLLVDDDVDIHAALRLSLQDMLVEGVPLQLLDAYSAAEARELLARNTEIALILLDVVMETSDAGLALVQHIRQEKRNRTVRIVLLTGQPGYSPQREIVMNYEIDDYRLKSDLSADKLFTCVYAELRTYQALRMLEKKRLVEQLADELRGANAQLKVEIAEHQRAQAIADARMHDLVVLNRKLEDAQNKLLQSEKLASIGLLAAGVAHEMNNPIGFVNSNLGTLKHYAESLLAILDAYEAAEAGAEPRCAGLFSKATALKAACELEYLKDDLRQLFRESQDGLDRVRKIIQSLKDFSRTDAAETWRLDDINQGLESTLCVVWNELKYKCEVRKEYGDLPAIECVMSNLNQVFMNLLVNAAHAIHEQGVVTVRTGCAGDEVWVEIADNGEGIAPENLSHIFDPFFTTRAVGKGSGLGLSISYGIIEKHHGRIEVGSELGRGTRFRIGLPVRQPGEHLMEGGD